MINGGPCYKAWIAIFLKARLEKNKGVVMKKGIIMALVVAVCLSVALIGCGAQKEASSQAAIQKSQSMATIQQKTDYLVGQARAFINSKNFEQAVNVAQYTLSNVNSNSQEARALLEKAKSEIVAQANKAMADAKQKFSGFGK
jgi:uncharacterized lipoprotein YehR (DUF1307 family)